MSNGADSHGVVVLCSVYSLASQKEACAGRSLEGVAGGAGALWLIPFPVPGRCGRVGCAEARARNWRLDTEA